MAPRKVASAVPQASAGGKKEKRTAEEAKSKPKKSPHQVCAEKIRYHKELESRWAILQEVRVEYFRGKDFSDVVKKHPDLAQPMLSKEDADELKDTIDQEVLGELLASGLVLRCDRMVKTIRPGKKKLSKWPARLEIHPVQAFSTDDAFYSWTFERKSPIWQTILTILFPIFTVACCLFPVFPYWCKLTVLYFLLSLIAAIFGLLLVRLVVFTIIWVFTGKRVWYFPRILEEEGTLAELFKFWPDKDEEPPAKLTTRAAVVVMLGFTFWLMVTYAPDQNTRARYRKKVTNIIDEFITWSPAMIAGNTTSSVNETLANTTTASNTTNTTETSDQTAKSDDHSWESYDEILASLDEEDVLPKKPEGSGEDPAQAENQEL